MKEKSSYETGLRIIGEDSFDIYEVIWKMLDRSEDMPYEIESAMMKIAHLFFEIKRISKDTIYKLQSDRRWEEIEDSEA